MRDTEQMQVSVCSMLPLVKCSHSRGWITILGSTLYGLEHGLCAKGAAPKRIKIILPVLQVSARCAASCFERPHTAVSHTQWHRSGYIMYF